MKNIAKLLSALFMPLAMTWVPQGHADNTYVGINYTNLELTDGLENLSIASGSGRLGVSFNEYLSFEWRAGTGLSAETVTTEAGRTEYILDKFYGGYLRGGILLLDRVYPYVMVGHTWVKVNLHTDVIDDGPEASLGERREERLEGHDTSFGIGADFKLGGAISLNLEYSRYFNEAGDRIEGPTVGLVAHFHY